MKRCPVCAELLADDLSICPFCGEPLNSPPPPPNTVKPQDNRSEANAPNMVKCPVCGELIAPGLAVCPICGETLAAAPAEPPARPEPPAPPQPEPPTPSQPEPPAPPQPEPPTPSQPEPPAPVVLEPEPVEPEPPAPPQPEPSPRQDSAEMKPCPVCGEMVSIHQDTCPYCLEPTGFGALASAIPAAAAAASTPTPEPVVEPTPRYTPEPVVEPTPQYTPEPVAEPTTQYSSGPAQYTPEPEPVRPAVNDSAYQGQGGYGNAPGYSNNEPPVPPVAPPVAPAQKGGGMKWLIIALLALLALAIGGLLYYFLSKDKSDDDDEKIENAEVKPNATVERQESDSIDMNMENTLIDEEVDEKDIEPAAPVQQVEKPKPAAAPAPAPAPPSRVGRPDPNYDGAYDDVGSPRDRHRHGQGYDRPPRRGVDADEWQDRHHRNGPPHRGRDRNNEDVAPPQSSGTGFHFERQDGRTPQRGNSGNNSGFQLQEVDRIPNQ